MSPSRGTCVKRCLGRIRRLRGGHGGSTQSDVDDAADLKTIDKPTLILHGDDDRIVPIGAAGLMSADNVPGATPKVYKGGPHGMTLARRHEVNADLLAFNQA